MNKEDSFYMDTLEKTQPETFDFINHLSEQCHSELSFASHEINNQLSFIRSSYQLISKKHPETKDFPFWAELGDAVNHIISYMERTGLYRYSFKYVPAKLNLTEFLYSLPDVFDEQFPNRANLIRIHAISLSVPIPNDCCPHFWNCFPMPPKQTIPAAVYRFIPMSMPVVIR